MKHKHHIIPKHMGGTDDPSNLVEVSIEEHIELHKQLWEQLGNWQDYLAWQGLSGRIGKEEIIREKIINSNKKRKGQICGDKNPAKRQDVKQKISDALKGRESPTKGMKYSDESKNKQSASGKNWWINNPIEADKRRKQLIERNKMRK